MAVVKLNVSLEPRTAAVLRERATTENMPTSRYLARLIEEDARRAKDELAAEGYRALSADTAEFAQAAWPLANETWPEWRAKEEASDNTSPAR